MTRKVSIALKITGVSLLVLGCLTCTLWFYILTPAINIHDPEWIAKHSEKGCWEEERKLFQWNSVRTYFYHWPCHHVGSSRYYDYANRDDILQYYDLNHPVKLCCAQAAMSCPTNWKFGTREEWDAWMKVHRDESQEEWIKSGFEKHGVIVHLPPQQEDIEPLLILLGRSVSNSAQTDKDGENAHTQNDSGETTSTPYYVEYNAFRWLRDSRFSPVEYALDNPKAANNELIRKGLEKFEKLYGYYPREAGMGILSFGESKYARDMMMIPYMATPRMKFLWTTLALLPLLLGIPLLIFTRKRGVD
jgi:hypothetical protein